MTRNELIESLIKAIGVALLVWVILEVPPFLYLAFSTFIDAGRLMINGATSVAFEILWNASRWLRKHHRKPGNYFEKSSLPENERRGRESIR